MAFRRLNLFLLLAVSFLQQAVAQQKLNVIRPGEVWPDNNGQHIQAHGGGILNVGKTYYWFGEDRRKENRPGFRYVACYASKDLLNWEFRNQVFVADTLAGISRGLILERPKVYYNAKTKKYVMYMHLDSANYKFASVGVAVCDKPDGNYTFVRSFRPLGKESRDIGQFVDDDGSAYLIFESRPTGGFYIAKLSDDYLDVAQEVSFIKAPIEGGAVVHHEGLYYVLGSALTGWNPNPNKYATATSLAGPWSELKDIAPPETKTYGSQSTLLLKVVGKKGTTVIYMGDQWRPRTQWDSRYLWMPVEIGNGRLWLPEPKPWKPDLKAGTVKILN